MLNTSAHPFCVFDIMVLFAEYKSKGQGWWNGKIVAKKIDFVTIEAQLYVKNDSYALRDALV